MPPFMYNVQIRERMRNGGSDEGYGRLRIRNDGWMKERQEGRYREGKRQTRKEQRSKVNLNTFC